MRILYDHQTFSLQDYGGVSRYYYELISRVKKTKNHVLINGKFSNNVYINKLKKHIINFLPGFNFPYKNILLFYLNNILDDRIFDKRDFDLLHATNYYPYFLNKLKGKPYVVTVYDMIHELFSKDYRDLQNKTAEYKKTTIMNANQIIAISENTKNDIVRMYGIPKNRITVTYLGNSLSGISPKKISGLPEKYMLYVGNRLGYKNFIFFVNSIGPLLRQESNLFLVCAGGPKFSSKETFLFSKLKIQDKIMHIHFNGDNELAYIYKNAFVYVLPSLYEGFGMTAIEAFSMGCPVVASETGSIPEVCGEAAIYINPKKRDSIRNGVLKVISDIKTRENLINLGFSQVKKFTWEGTVNKTLRVYRSAIKD